MRILVTGACGFVGQHLLRRLGERGHEIVGTVLGRAPRSDIRKLSLVSCDIRNADCLTRVVKSFKPQRIYHLAALSSVRDSFDNVQDVFKANLVGTLNLLEAAKLEAPKSRVLVVGSAQMYGEPKHSRPITEETPLRPQSPYAASKAAADLLAYQYWKAYGLHVIRARPFNHTGPGQPPTFVCSDFAKQVAEIDLELRKPVISVGNLDVKRDFSDVRDVVRAYELLMSKGQPGEAYNVAAQTEISIRQVLQILRACTTHFLQVKVADNKIRACDVKTLRANSKKLRKATGWRPGYDIHTTLLDLYEDWKQRLS